MCAYVLYIVFLFKNIKRNMSFLQNMGYYSDLSCSYIDKILALFIASCKPTSNFIFDI